MKKGLKLTSYLGFAALLLAGCDGGNGRGGWLNPNQAQQQGQQQYGGGNLYGGTQNSQAGYNSGGTYRQDGYGGGYYNSSIANECLEQCARDENGELFDDCPDHCVEYRFNYLKGVNYDADLNPAISFESGFGASRLGNSIRTPGLRERYMSTYFKGQPGGFRDWDSNYFRQHFPHGLGFPQGSNNAVAKAPNYFYVVGALDKAIKYYETGNQNADSFFESVKQDIQINQPHLNINFDQLKLQFQGVGRAFRNAGVNMVNQLSGSLSGAVNGLANSAGSYQLAPSVVLQDGVRTGTSMGYSNQYNPNIDPYIYRAMSYGHYGYNGSSNDPCITADPNWAYYYYVCKR